MNFQYERKKDLYWIKSDELTFTIPVKYSITPLTCVEFNDKMIEDIVNKLNAGKLPIFINDGNTTGKIINGESEYTWNMSKDESARMINKLDDI